MANPIPHGRRTQRAPAVAEVDVLWLSAGLSCDGDSVAITGATQPSIEDVVMGAIPGLPKVHLHHPLLAYETGADFLALIRQVGDRVREHSGIALELEVEVWS